MNTRMALRTHPTASPALVARLVQSPVMMFLDVPRQPPLSRVGRSQLMRTPAGIPADSILHNVQYAQTVLRPEQAETSDYVT
jgi:hypothetical protein